MATGNKLRGFKLPIKPEYQGGAVAQGFITPKQDGSPQVHSIPPKRVIPIIFIPGIMGSNLRMSADRQASLKNENNIAWRPDNIFVTVPMQNDTAAERQLRFDPLSTELDTYDVLNGDTGDVNETADMRNKSIHFSDQYAGSWKRIEGPLLQSDRPGVKDAKTRDQKARARGWGEIFFNSYEEILSTCEVRLNGSFSESRKDSFLMDRIVNVSPSEWGAHPNPSLNNLDEKTLCAAIKGCWFPVHAMGYNWLKSNMESGIVTARRVKALITYYQGLGYQCEKVILVTHSMGGLVARAMIHPEMGKIHELVLGVVHGVMPAIGAGTAYKRMRCGFEGSGISVKILGATGQDVTPVLGNSQGGLELLPSQAYGNGWLRFMQGGKAIKSLPENGDPYEEIYKANDKWYGLLREEWINPANLPGANLARANLLLDRAKFFHRSMANTYHENSYAHYGADPDGRAWNKVNWEISGAVIEKETGVMSIISDDGKGSLILMLPKNSSAQENKKGVLSAKMLAPTDPGDQTVPAHSADAQLRSGKFKGIFRQIGYEHQGSYSNEKVISATLYSLLKIIATMKWSK